MIWKNAIFWNSTNTRTCTHTRTRTKYTTYTMKRSTGEKRLHVHKNRGSHRMANTNDSNNWNGTNIKASNRAATAEKHVKRCRSSQKSNSCSNINNSCRSLHGNISNRHNSDNNISIYIAKYIYLLAKILTKAVNESRRRQRAAIVATAEKLSWVAVIIVSERQEKQLD